MIGVAAATPGIINRKLRIEQLGGIRAGPGGIKRRMLDQPDALARLAGMDRGGARLHIGERRIIIGQAGTDGPFGRGKGGHRAGYLARRGASRKTLRSACRQGWTGAPKIVTFAATGKSKK
jgi:hypothetical protein